ncbi:MAG: CRISPR-associated endonuclease Cas2 [Clostridia bacterium]|nr:CRISPR-associated endonuclease Cas2 [Clostridia bacterium]
MIIVSYDISSDKLRRQFSTFISKFGYRLQYSVFEIKNSEHILNNIRTEIQNNFGNRFSDEDSVIIFQLSNTCKIERYGYAKHDEDDLLIIK